MEPFEMVNDHFEVDKMAQTSSDNNSSDSGSESDSTNTPHDFEEVDFKMFDLWDDAEEKKEERKKKKKPKKEKEQEEALSATSVQLLPEPSKALRPRTFLQTLNEVQPSSIFIDPEVLQSMLSYIQALHTDGGALKDMGPQVTSNAVVPWTSCGHDNHVAKKPCQTQRYRDMFFRAQKRLAKLKKELATCEDVLDLKTWLLECLSSELRLAQHDKETLHTANDQLAKDNRRLQRGIIQHSKMAVCAATAAAKASIIQERNADFCTNINSLTSNVWELKEGKRQLVHKIVCLTKEISELQAFVKVLQGDLDNLIYNLVAKGVVKVKDSNGNPLVLERLAKAMHESDWNTIKTRKDEVRFLAVVSAHESTLEKMKNQVEQLLSQNDLLEIQAETFKNQVKQDETTISELRRELQAEKCMGRLICNDLENAKDMLQGLKESKETLENLFNRERKKSADLRTELIKCERQLLQRVDSLEHAMQASTLLKNKKVRTCEQCSQTIPSNTSSIGTVTIQPTKDTSAQTCVTEKQTISLRPNTFKIRPPPEGAAKKESRPSPDGASVIEETVIAQTNPVSASCMKNLKTTLDEVKQKAYHLAFSNCWEKENKQEVQKSESLKTEQQRQNKVENDFIKSCAEPRMVARHTTVAETKGNVMMEQQLAITSTVDTGITQKVQKVPKTTLSVSKKAKKIKHKLAKENHAVLAKKMSPRQKNDTRNPEMRELEAAAALLRVKKQQDGVPSKKIRVSESLLPSRNPEFENVAPETVKSGVDIKSEDCGPGPIPLPLTSVPPNSESKTSKKKKSKQNCNVAYLAEVLEKVDLGMIPDVVPNSPAVPTTVAEMEKPDAPTIEPPTRGPHAASTEPEAQTTEVYEVTPATDVPLVHKDNSLGSNDAWLEMLEIDPEVFEYVPWKPQPDGSVAEDCGGVCAWNNCGGCKDEEAAQGASSSVPQVSDITASRDALNVDDSAILSWEEQVQQEVQDQVKKESVDSGKQATATDDRIPKGKDKDITRKASKSPKKGKGKGLDHSPRQGRRFVAYPRNPPRSSWMPKQRKTRQLDPEFEFYN